MPDPIVPKFDAMMNPLIEALRQLGGSGTNEEIEAKVAEVMGLSDEQVELPYEQDKGGRTSFEYRLAWARSYLKRFGVLENSTRGVWSLTALGRSLSRVNPKEVKREVRKANRATNESDDNDDSPSDAEAEVATWRDEVLEVLHNIDSAAFERLVQRLLRESGFVQVEVTGRSGDMGIDGKGILRLGGLLGFNVIFQAKRWKDTVGASQVRDFRGAMVGRADKALFITTATFTKDAMREATRDGAPTIDLIDGEQLVEKLKEFSLGVRTKKVEVEEVTVDPNWFESI
jgi:restriction system protein